jgi:hypothetical protein
MICECTVVSSIQFSWKQLCLSATCIDSCVSRAVGSYPKLDGKRKAAPLNRVRCAPTNSQLTTSRLLQVVV